MRLIIAGSRTVSPTIEDIDREARELLLDLLAVDSDKPVEFTAHFTEVICGDASGADSAGAHWARHHGIPLHHEPITREDMAVHGKYLGPKMRNRRMAERGTHLLAFWDGKSGGTADMVCRMVAREKMARVVPFKAAERRAPTR